MRFFIYILSIDVYVSNRAIDRNQKKGMHMVPYSLSLDQPPTLYRVNFTRFLFEVDGGGFYLRF